MYCILSLIVKFYSTKPISLEEASNEIFDDELPSSLLFMLTKNCLLAVVILIDHFRSQRNLKLAFLYNVNG